MSNPAPNLLVEKVTELAQSLGADSGLEVVTVSYKTHSQPPTLRVDIRHPQRPTGIEDCAHLSRLLEAELDLADWAPNAYLLEVSSPGIDRKLTTEREFLVFRGFPVRVTGYGPIEGQKVWEGKLLKRDETTLHLNIQGRVITLPLDQIASVQLTG
jgi:ribosome maturation factor RimP